MGGHGAHAGYSAQVTQELQEALQALHAVCNENDECQDFTCFVEAVAATATTLSMLYAPAMDLTRLQHGTLTPEGSPWGCTVLSKAGLLGKCAMLGISTGVGICSAAFTTTLMHPEDMGLPSLNLELDGDHKIWYWVPSSRLGDFLHVLKKLLPDGAIKSAAAAMAFRKMLSPVLTANQAKDAGVCRYMQKPFYMVVNAPVSMFHIHAFTIPSTLIASEYFHTAQ